MRRAIGVVLIGLGIFGVVMAILFPTVVVSKSKKTPLDLNITQVSSGPTKLLDAATNQVKDVTLRATRFVRTDSSASDGTNTTVNETLCIVVVNGTTANCLPSSDPRLLSITTDRVTADRKSADSVHVARWNENVNGDTSVRHTGMSYKFPIDSQKKNYQFFQPDVKKAFLAQYKGTDKVRGLTVYRYVCSTGDQPYKIQGIADGTYNDVRTVWVEPRTGAIVNGTEHQVQTLDNGTVALDTVLSFEKSAIDFQSNYAKGKIDDLRQAQIWAPLVAAVVGVLALVGAFFLLRRRGEGGGRRGRHHADTNPRDDPGTYAEDPAVTGSSQT